MGTGSHRPQWETAKGRPDITGGIKHARALKSHTQLKFRDPTKFKPQAKAIEGSKSSRATQNDSTTETKAEPQSEPQSHITNSEDEFDDSEDDEDELKRELLLIDKRQKLKSQLAKPPKPKASSWKSESAFRRKPQNKDTDFLDKVVK